MIKRQVGCCNKETVEYDVFFLSHITVHVGDLGLELRHERVGAPGFFHLLVLHSQHLLPPYDLRSCQHACIPAREKMER